MFFRERYLFTHKKKRLPELRHVKEINEAPQTVIAIRIYKKIRTVKTGTDDGKPKNLRDERWKMFFFGVNLLLMKLISIS